jgi:hypothetical protein
MQRSAAAQGLLRSGGTLKDIIKYGQGMGAQQYQNAFNRAAQSYGINRETAQAMFAPRYSSWETEYGGNLQKWLTKYGGELQKYLTRENQIYGLLNPTLPSY